MHSPVLPLPYKYDMNLSKDIQNLLYTEPCVIIPDFGGFVTHHKESEIDNITKTIKPAYKKLAFNAALTANDGILANYLKNTYQISFQKAMDHIHDFVLTLRETLQEKRNADMTGIGSFYLNAEQRLLFIPYHNVLFSKQNYGLPILRLRPKTQKTQTSPSISKEVQNNLTEKSVEVFPITTLSKDVLKREKKKPLAEIKEKPFEKKSKNYLTKIANVLGLVVIFGLIISIVVNELKMDYNQNANYASIIDHSTEIKPISKTQKSVSSIISDYQKSIEKQQFGVVIQKTFSQEEALKIREELLKQFPYTEIQEHNNNEYKISLITFENEHFANDYKILIQPRVKHPLTIHK